MAEITLADYTGYIFLEIIKAREMADRHSRELAQRYAQDPVLQHFAVPRFKVPKMELTIPVLISGARFSQAIRFDMPQDKFVAYVMGRVTEVQGKVRAGGDIFRTGVIQPRPGPVTIPRGREATKGRRARAVARGPTLEQLALEFHNILANNPDPSQPGGIVRELWTRMFQQALIESDLVADYRKFYPNNDLFKSSLDDVMGTVTAHTVVDSTTIQSLLINPETNVVKQGSSDTSVFTIKAEMLEEGFFIRSVRDESTGQVSQIVEFE